jgi:exonuclease SbcC
MLDDLFKPAWKSRSVEKRLRAITEMDSVSAEHQKILFQLARDDEDSSIRIAAIGKLTSAAALHELSIKFSDSAVRTEAEKRVNELMGADHALDEAQYRDLLKHYPELQLRIAAHADSSSVRTEVIQILSSQQLLEVLGATVYTDSRQLIAEKLSNMEDLESARKIMRGKDKNAERIIKTKIDAFRSHERQHAENLARLENLIEEVEYLANHDWLPEFKARCLAHRKQWEGLEFDIDDDSRQRYQTAREIVDTHYEQQRVTDETRQSQQQLVSELEALLQIAARRDLASSLEVLSEMQSQQQKFSSGWQALANIIPPDRLILNQYDKMLGALHSATQFVAKVADLVQDTLEDSNQIGDTSSLSKNSRQLEATLKNLKWPADFVELQVATDLQLQMVDWRKARKASAEAYEQKLAMVHNKISSIFRFSHAGNLTRAKQIAEKVKKSFSQFDGKDLLNLQERLEEASKTLGDMSDWKNFATEPKYIELCDAMELLATSKQHPDKRSSEMKALQQQWKALGHSDVSNQYWPRFKLAADKVYQPCAEFFEQRHKVRKSNLEQRQQYVEQMRELLETTDWDNNPDYKEVQSSVRSICDSFTSVKDVERNAGRKQWKQLSKFKDAVSAKLDVVYEANIALKQDLIRQTEVLAEATAKVENLVTLKTLQTRWKHIGITRRNQDQKAWTAFKKHGDIVYNKVQELRQGKRDETDQQLNAYREIIKDIQKLARTASDLAESDQQFSVLQANYAALPDLPLQLPEKLSEGIQRDYHKACDQYDNSHSRIIKNRHNQQIEALRSKANICAQQEALGASPSEQQLHEISLQWDSIELQNVELSRRIEARRETAQSAIDRAAIGAERRMLCIQLEIAMGVESPAEDTALRRQYQLEQMSKSGLGQQPVNNKELLETMELDWLCMPGAQAEQQKALDKRFQHALRSA